MTKREFETLLAEVIRPTTSQMRRYEIGKRFLTECGQKRLDDALGLCQRGRIDIGVSHQLTGEIGGVGVDFYVIAPAERQESA